MNKFSLSVLLAASIGFSGHAHANEYQDQAMNLAKTKLHSIVANPAVISGIKAQNDKHAALSQPDIDALDKKWRAGDDGLISATLGNAASSYLKSVKESGGGLYTEIFIMDNKGLNVGQSDKTSDYWQGDEAKWQKTFKVGKDAIHVSDVEEDESTQTFQVQVSIPVTDAGQVIGAATFGVNAEMME